MKKRWIETRFGPLSEQTMDRLDLSVIGFAAICGFSLIAGAVIPPVVGLLFSFMVWEWVPIAPVWAVVRLTFLILLVIWVLCLHDIWTGKLDDDEEREGE